MSSNLVVRSPRAIWRLATFLALTLGFAAPLAAQPPLGPQETLVFDDNVGPGNPDVTGLAIGPWQFALQNFHTVSLSDAPSADAMPAARSAVARSSALSASNS